MPTKKQPNNDYAEKAALYDKLVATHPEIQRKGDTMPYTSHKGNMFSYLGKNGLMALRLPEDEREKFLKKYKTTLYAAYGIIQKEYVTVPDSLLANTNELKKYLGISYTYVQSLKAKPTKKAKN